MDRIRKGYFQRGNPGRPKGAKNKFTTLKAAFLGAFEDAGGQEMLLKLARNPKNQMAFVKMVAQMLPKDVQVSGSEGAPFVPPVIQIVGVESDGNGHRKLSDSETR